MVLLFGLVVAGCTSGEDSTPTDFAPTGGPDSANAASTTSEPTTSNSTALDCPDTTTTTGATTSTGLPTVCELIEELPPDQVPPGGATDYEVWSGTISGTVDTPGCDPVSQSGQLILVVFSDGDLSGAGETVAGAYTCDNGASIPETTNRFGIDGRMTDVFTLTFSDGVQLASGSIAGGHAEIVQDTGAGVVTIELRCENC
jgi:hypothetical protein